ncbi:glutamate ABC transporter substrate-binding protein [Streptomyces zagrosensis]|uniref:Polar amino acid transport system substrate-binding protein n=1 Tax=Streptomyces zagrosensis TaxID=1042984 RepID=A0A7W9Q7B1_9ACTN|nr:glutamate ABC transporter substrate-binding protein [Streptomyces zagrosensis]MBB5934946.1 polar amino acid transport system substrate-binding protein [Streptomyces zagrosensis]
MRTGSTDGTGSTGSTQAAAAGEAAGGTASPGGEHAAASTYGAAGTLRAGQRPAGRRRTVALSVAGCALAVTAALLAPAAFNNSGHSSHREQSGQRAHSRQAVAPARDGTSETSESCQRPEESLRPLPITGDAVRRIKNRKPGKLIAGVDQNSFRWGYRDPATGELAGFDIDLVRAIAQEIFGDRNAVIFRTIPTSQRIPALQQRTVDIVVRTMTINCDRIKKVAFSTAYFQAGQQLMVPQDSTITSYGPSLRGKRVCTATSSTGEGLLDDDGKRGARALGATKVTVPNQLDCLVRLQLGQVDAVLTDNALAAGQAAQDPSVKLVGVPLTKEPYGVAMNLEDTDLVRRVNKVLEDYRKGGKDSPWMQAYRYWLQDDLKGITAPPQPAYKD